MLEVYSGPRRSGKTTRLAKEIVRRARKTNKENHVIAGACSSGELEVLIESVRKRLDSKKIKYKQTGSRTFKLTDGGKIEFFPQTKVAPPFVGFADVECVAIDEFAYYTTEQRKRIQEIANLLKVDLIVTHTP